LFAIAVPLRYSIAKGREAAPRFDQLFNSAVIAAQIALAARSAAIWSLP
jgi:hypothetical protein